ncbi:hypothetical protein TNIN_395551 [Trichonephila inaurata madagascariensis]|uniref:Uncharacterized protein n=1 Tax=Trichonephila inaurata madagascariensis TaxID=2747483 RepID=A0A8X6WWC6_9ARAC|nr:hypothetical protein TNIN_395551 [Trichonephila inaurata madagascariensis]
MSEKSFKSRFSTSTRCGTPKPAEPTTDCERRRQAIVRLERQNVLISGYQRFLIMERAQNDEAEICKDLEKNLQETIEARDQLPVERFLTHLRLTSNRSASSQTTEPTHSGTPSSPDGTPLIIRNDSSCFTKTMTSPRTPQHQSPCRDIRLGKVRLFANRYR